MQLSKEKLVVHDRTSGASDLAELVAARLRRSGYPYLRSIQCEQQDESVLLSGTVPTFHLKQVAQALASHTPGVRGVVDRLRVTNRDLLAQ